MLDKAFKRCDLGQFLRNRRARIDPSTVGLPAGRRRRTAGLRREEVATLAGLSATWYSYLEQGRDINVSAEVLDSLARVLQLNEDECGYLHVLASRGRRRRPSPKAPATQPYDDELLWEMVRAFDPRYPVYAVNSEADLLAWNDAAEEWYTDFAKLPDTHRNTVWWILMEPEARERLLNWEEDARDMVGRLRAASARSLDKERLTYLINELSDHSPEFREWWSDYSISNRGPCVRWFRHAVLGVQAVRKTVVLPVGAGDVAVVLHFPVSDDDCHESGSAEIR